MSSQWPPDLSLWEKSTIIAAIARTLGTGLYTLCIAPFRGSEGAATITKHVKIAMVRSLLTNLSIAQSQYLIPDLKSTYSAHAKQKNFKPEIVDIDSETKGYWIGNSKSRDVLVWFHGGGYTVPADPGHLQFASMIVDSARAIGKDLAVLFPSYGLAPQATYPRQLQQGAESLKYILEKTGRKPENVMIGGDSAGANLALGVLSHILHPHPSGSVPPLTLSGPLKGAIFLSPWFSFDTSDPLFERLKLKDSVQASIGDLWSTNFLGGKPKDEYNEPITADQGWWDGLEKTVQNIFVLGGADEVLVGSIKEMGRRLEKAHPRTTTLIAQGEYHDRPVLSMVDTPGTGQMAEGIYGWVKARL